ncbi:MAG: 30S ribosomal protein S7 [Patescibacteria group bacterium]
MRRPFKKKHRATPDPVYGSLLVSKLTNYVMERGKKDTARRVVYAMLEDLKKEGDPITILETAIKNVEPAMEVRSRRVGGANYQVPTPVRPERQLALSLRWIIGAARAKKGTPLAQKLSTEILAAHKGTGEAVGKRDNMHKMAEANKAFAHFAW